MGLEISGKMVEHDLIGEISRELKEREKSIDYRMITNEALMNMISESQLSTKRPFNPCPNKRLPDYSQIKDPRERKKAYRAYLNSENIPYPFPYCLHLAIGKLLGLNESDWQNGKLRIFTAISSILDRGRGIDGFVELIYDEEKVLRVTFDLTTNPQKKDTGHKADFIILVPDGGFDYFDDYDVEKFDEIIEEYSDEIAQAFQSRIKNLEKGGEKKDERND